MFDDIVKKDQLKLALNSPQRPENFPDYIEGWRIRVWDKVFLGNFKGSEVFKKSNDFKKRKGSDDVVKRVIYRYELLLLSLLVLDFVDLLFYVFPT